MLVTTFYNSEKLGLIYLFVCSIHLYVTNLPECSNQTFPAQTTGCPKSQIVGNKREAEEVHVSWVLGWAGSVTLRSLSAAALPFLTSLATALTTISLCQCYFTFQWIISVNANCGSTGRNGFGHLWISPVFSGVFFPSCFNLSLYW